jgi:hypothetical protein
MYGRYLRVLAIGVYAFVTIYDAFFFKIPPLFIFERRTYPT